MIGSARSFNGLYVLKACQSLHHVNFLDYVFDSALWHYKLRHASYNCMNQIKNNFPFVKFNKNHICDVCYQSKQRKLPFSLSNSYALHKFDLIHVDI
ncbi:putative GAG-pre-integrase domain-containing protein [Lupinus albus]|uniref:Putative GAG-pre-integrase domain-containing protein n=1 Tax=Lupinus albus TaxID=3870 RepID=A0A6A4Q431_LUPAL|nr:putative GAG-pre-integrase domain-containing protein [Lupinus albus]